MRLILLKPKKAVGACRSNTLAHLAGGTIGPDKIAAGHLFARTECHHYGVISAAIRVLSEIGKSCMLEFTTSLNIALQQKVIEVSPTHNTHCTTLIVNGKVYT